MELIFDNKGKLTKVMDGDEMVNSNIFKKTKKRFPFLRIFLKKKNRDCITVTSQEVVGYI